MNHDMMRRFAYIETQVLWGDGLTAGDLGAAFGIARQNAQAVVKAYRQRHPENLVYDRRRKRHVRAERFEARYIKKDPYLFLDYQRGMALAGYFQVADDWADLPFQDADRLLRPHLDGEAIRVVLTALRQRRTVKVVYLAKGGARQRLLSPHQLVYADNRYHLRAFCHFRQIGRDFVLSRIQQAEFSREDWISGKYDEEWHRMETLRFDLNPELPEETRASLWLAYALDDRGCLTITLRKALSKYVVRRMTRPDAALKLPFWICREDLVDVPDR